MLTISATQFAALERLAQQSFHERVLDHLHRCFPDACRRLGADAVREWIRAGEARAAIWGLRAERDVCKYIDLMFTLGAEFDTDPDYPWTTPLLSDDSVPPGTRIDRVVDATLAELARHAGFGC